jgi:hypothetical protein
MRSRVFVIEEVVDAIKRYLAKKPLFPESFAVIMAHYYSGLLRLRGKGEHITGRTYYCDLIRQSYQNGVSSLKGTAYHIADIVAECGRSSYIGPSFVDDALLFSIGRCFAKDKDIARGDSNA